MAAGFPASLGPASYFESCQARKIFIQSTHDRYGPRAEMEALFARAAEPKELVWVEAADHFFAGALDQFEAAVVRTAGDARHS